MILTPNIGFKSVRGKQKQEPEPPAPIPFSIITPTEGEEITGDLNIQLEVEASTLRVISPTEGQEITGDLQIQLELE